jgi:hypothetical protein
LGDSISNPWFLHLFGQVFCPTSVHRLKVLSPSVNVVRLGFCDGLDGEPVRELLGRVLDLLPHRPRDPADHLLVLQNVFLAIAQAHAECRAHGKQCVIGFLAGTSYYRRADGACVPGHRAVVGTIQALEKLGLIQVHISRVDGVPSYFVSTAKFHLEFPWSLNLLWLVTGHNRVRVMTKKEVRYEPQGGRLVTKVLPGSHRPVIKLTSTQHRDVARVQNELAGINTHVCEYDYYLCDARGEWFRCGLKDVVYQIVFNDSSTRLGGRNYNQLQNQPQRHGTPMRQTLRIGLQGQPPRETIELDFKNLHFLMAYHLLGHDCLDDCYDIPLAEWKLPDKYSPDEQRLLCTPVQTRHRWGRKTPAGPEIGRSHHDVQQAYGDHAGPRGGRSRA